MFLKQGDGRTVLQPNGKPWPAEGMDAPDTLFIRRRLRDLDLIPAEPPAEAPVAIEEPAIDPPPADAAITELPANAGGKKSTKE